MLSDIKEAYAWSWNNDRVTLIIVHTITLAAIALIWLIMYAISTGQFDIVQQHKLPDGRTVTCINQNLGVSCDWNSAQ